MQILLGPKIADVGHTKLTTNLIAVVSFFLVTSVGVLLAQNRRGYVDISSLDGLWVLTGIAVIVPFHEALHGVGMMWFATIPWANVRFGFAPRQLAFFCHTEVPMRVGAYKRLALLPLWFTGASILAALIVFPRVWLAVLLGFAIAACVGDVALVLRLRRFDNRHIVVDSATAAGCTVYSGT